MIFQRTEVKESVEPETLGLMFIIEKNLWLTKVRWAYTIFIYLFFLLFKYFKNETIFSNLEFNIVFLLPVVGNIIFGIYIKQNRNTPIKYAVPSFLSLAVLQLDFDMVVLSLMAFLSGGSESPILILFLFYIMISTFLITEKKASRNTITAMILVTLIFFKAENFNLSTEKFLTLLGFIILLFFAFRVSAYLSANIRANDKTIRNLLEKTQLLSKTDGLTGLYNQAYFLEFIKNEVARSGRHKHIFSLIVFDVDNFKNYNDNNGHIKGSAVLQQIGDIMKKQFRESDFLAKYGGDEFVILLPHTDKVGAFLAADRLRGKIEETSFDGEVNQPMGKITISVGISSYPEHGEDEETLVNAADKSMYYSKSFGRNKVTIYSENIESEETE